MVPLLFATLSAIASPHLVVRSSTAAIDADRAVGDLLALDAGVAIAGVVRGFTYAVSSTITLRSTAVLLSPISMHGGQLHVEPGAKLPRTLILAGTEVFGDLPADVEVHRERRPSRSQAAQLARYLPFARPIPAGDFATWRPSPDAVLEFSLDDPTELVVGGVAKLTIASTRVRHAMQRGFRSPEGTTLFTAVELVDAATGREFWEALDRIPERSVSSSIKSGLGDGAHWWFVKGKRGCLLWQRDRWFFALETIASDPRSSLAFTERAQVSLSETLGEQP